MGKSKSTRPRRLSRAELRFADRMTENVQNAPAIVEVAQVRSIEAKFLSEGKYTRQSASVILSITGAELMERTIADRSFAATAAHLQQSIVSYTKWVQEYLDNILGAAEARLMIALAQRPDMMELMKEVETGERKVIPFPRRMVVDQGTPL